MERPEVSISPLHASIKIAKIVDKLHYFSTSEMAPYIISGWNASLLLFICANVALAPFLQAIAIYKFSFKGVIYFWL